MPFDKEIIDARIEKIRVNTAVLKNLSELSLEEFESENEHVAAAERLLQVSIEAMLDIGNHIIAEKSFEQPQEYKDIFIILGSHGVFDKSFVDILNKMVGLRNLLVHVYLEVDPGKIYELLKDKLVDFETFIKVILKYIDSN